MTLYTLLKQISDILTQEDDSFYKYAMYTSDDDGGFLRTRHCWWPDKPVKDLNLGDGFEIVMVTAKNEIDIVDLKDESDTLVKLQITYSQKKAAIEDADWDAQLGYCYVYLFDLKNHTYTMEYVKNPIKA